MSDTTDILRLAEDGDFEKLLTMIRSYFEYDHIQFDEPAIRRSLPRLLRDHKIGRAWFIQQSGLVRQGAGAPVARTFINDAGYVIATFGFDLEFGGPQATITDVFLLPEFRRSGLGTKALKAIELELRAAGAGAIELRVEKDNAEAIAFYASLGFKPEDRIPLSKRL